MHILSSRRNRRLLAVFCLMAYASITSLCETISPQDEPEDNLKSTKMRIDSIAVEGTNNIPIYTILSKIPYRVGDMLTRSKTRLSITNIYSLGIVSCVQIKAIPQGSGIKLIIIITEKTPIRRINLEGTYALTKNFLTKKLELNDITALDEGDFHTLHEKIKKLYAEKDYHSIKTKGSFKDTAEGEHEAVITIEEGSPTRVQQVIIEGNTIISSSKLKMMLFTREDWILGFLNRAGSYQPEALEYDRGVIESFYQNNGYLTAKVTDIIVDPVPNTYNVNVTFKIFEGSQYTIGSVHALETTLLSEEEQLAVIPIRSCQLYSRETIRQTIETLRMLWGEYGYIYSEVSPSIVPNPENLTVDVTFHSILGNTMKLNRITITGNSKTDDTVIRRQLVLDEGELITTRKMELSKNRVQSLGYFDPKNGVNWNIVRHDADTANLELLLQEVKTGQFFAQMGFGGMPTDNSSPSDSFRISAGAQNSNWLGRGLQGSISVTYSSQDRSIDFTLADPWLLNRPLYGSIHCFHRRSRYEDFTLASSTPSELTTAGIGKLGFTIEQMTNTTILSEFGFESICFREIKSTDTIRALMQRKFQSGNVLSIGASMIQDMRNHPTHPTSGYLWNTGAKVGIPYSLCSTDFGFVKWDLDLQWYASLIDEYNLVFRFHTFISTIHQIGNYAIPYRELYHIGGPATVRGFTFGQIGPMVLDSSLGAKKALVVNAELLFPIRADGSIRGTLFYDGGAGWDTPDTQFIDSSVLRNNRFNYRHAIGFGIRLTQPTPVSIDIGFKLDRRKRFGESLSEVHFNMTRDF